MNVNKLDGSKGGIITLPSQFKEPLRKDLIKRAYNALRTHKIQPKGVSPSAGMRHVVDLSKRRKKYKSVYGAGRSRTPRKTMSRNGRRFGFMGAQVPFAVGGRTAHPSKSETVIKEKINKKERRAAIRSAISASNIIVMENKLEKLKKTKKVVEALEKNKVEMGGKKRLKKGKARLRGRGKSYSKGPLFIVSNNCDVLKSARNLPGVEAVKVKDLNVSLLAPGSKPGRTTIWSEDSIKKLKEEGLFL